MKVPRQLAMWGMAAIVSLGGLGIVVLWQKHDLPRRLTVQVASTPISGATVFRSKGCTSCHGTSGGGTELGPSLRHSSSLTTLPQIVTAMWNHAPRMWQEMRGKRLRYPILSYEETSQLVTYLYMGAHADDAGDAKRGESLFRQMRCIQCHSRKPNIPGFVDVADSEDPLSWTEALWNHASGMQARMLNMGIQWPNFRPSDLRDLFAYMRQERNLNPDALPNVSGDQNRGWELFQQKGCIRCHSIASTPGLLGPGLGADHLLPPTFSEFGASLLNHFPKMELAMTSKQAEIPHFEQNNVADMAVFLYSLHYLEPTGSPQVGRSIFAWRGCNACHGDDAQGTAIGPELRGRGQFYTAVRLATALWAHGARMYDMMKQHEQEWPALYDSDIGHLLTFLNTAP
jgi:cytochrome c2